MAVKKMTSKFKIGDRVKVKPIGFDTDNEIGTVYFVIPCRIHFEYIISFVPKNDDDFCYELVSECFLELVQEEKITITCEQDFYKWLSGNRN